ncbi:hypothetical protein BACI71_70617 [Bacillus mycoides]|uniref:Uncharacterized protein n=1 Tax=Bacillus mycoides TaxID=1405 RepID=A0A654BNW9_BACMY|nr:hypothetical protein BACI71_70617 [Bacillus mycoides]
MKLNVHLRRTEAILIIIFQNGLCLFENSIVRRELNDSERSRSRSYLKQERSQESKRNS